MKLNSANINVMVKACRKASKTLIRDFGEIENLQVSTKGPGDFVTSADKRTEKIIIEELQKAHPEYGIVTEEAGIINKTNLKNRWIIDPIDGTMNFLNGIPQFAISIAYEENNEIICGVIFNPISNEMFCAEKGNGAWLNDRRMRVSGRTQMEHSIFATGIPFLGRGDHKQFLQQIESVMAVSAGIRRFGSAALDLAYVAAGRFDGFWETNYCNFRSLRLYRFYCKI